MANMQTYLMVMSGILLIFYFAGLLEPTVAQCTDSTVSNALLCVVLSPEDLPESTLVKSIILLAIVGGIGIAIVIGAFFTGQIELAIVSPVAVFILSLLWSFLSVFNKVKSANPVIAILIFAPTLLYTAVMVLDWWRGRQ